MAGDFRVDFVDGKTWDSAFTIKKETITFTDFGVVIETPTEIHTFPWATIASVWQEKF
jgi:hypothetical protein